MGFLLSPSVYAIPRIPWDLFMESLGAILGSKSRTFLCLECQVWNSMKVVIGFSWISYLAFTRSRNHASPTLCKSVRFQACAHGRMLGVFIHRVAWSVLEQVVSPFWNPYCRHPQAPFSKSLGIPGALFWDP